MPSSGPSDDREKETIKQSLKSWWSNFTKSSKSSNVSSSSSSYGAGPSSAGGVVTASSSGAPLAMQTSTSSAAGKDRKDAVFGVPLRRSLKYASVAISMAGEDGKQYVWGYVPIIVAKAGLFLKENATEVEGVFRIAGSQKRMRELQETFDTPPKYGKHLTWDKFSVHDCASVLRRYLNQMPEPIVPLHLYNEFRNVMIKQPVDVEAATKTYRLLIDSMPPANRYLLLYVLDLLAVFARKSELNRMPASNLAVIFQPGIFSHPSHLQDADEHKVAIEVLQFLIDHQDYFVLAISPPPPTNVGPSELTSVSKAPEQLAPDVAELSDSDEDVGMLVAHEGGGARLARRSTTSEAQSRRHRVQKALFQRLPRKSPTPSPLASGRGTPSATSGDATPAGASGSAGPNDADIAEDIGEGVSREPGIAAEGEIHEVGITNDPPRRGIAAIGSALEKPILATKATVRRSKTVPSRKPGASAADEAASSTARSSKEAARSVSAGKSRSSRPSVEATPERPKEKVDLPSAAIEASTGGPEPEPTIAVAPSDLPTPPSSKVIDQAKVAPSAADEAASTTLPLQS